jgi:exosome complex component RRP46
MPDIDMTPAGPGPGSAAAARAKGRPAAALRRAAPARRSPDAPPLMLRAPQSGRDLCVGGAPGSARMPRYRRQQAAPLAGRRRCVSALFCRRSLTRAPPPHTRPRLHRALTCERGLLSRADGSAQWGQEGSVVLAAVYGPTAAGVQREDAERSVLEVIFKPRSGLAGPTEHEYEALLRPALEALVLRALHPRTLVRVVLQAVSEDGSLLACALNAAVVALADAGVPMRSLAAAMAVALPPGSDGSADGGALVDPDAAEERAAAAAATLAFQFRHVYDAAGEASLAVDEGAALCRALGALPAAALPATVALGRAGCEIVAAFMAMAIARGHDAAA